MNPQQRLVLIAGSIAVLMLTLFPPWIYRFEDSADRSPKKIPGEHAFVFLPPSGKDAWKRFLAGGAGEGNSGAFEMSIWLDGPRLAGELVGVVLATTGLVLAFWRRTEENTTSPGRDTPPTRAN
jgi:hypothetical protein